MSLAFIVEITESFLVQGRIWSASQGAACCERYVFLFCLGLRKKVVQGWPLPVINEVISSKWPYKWVTGVMTLRIGVTTPPTTSTVGAHLVWDHIPSRELTYPTLRKGKSSSNMPWVGTCDRSQEGIPPEKLAYMPWKTMVGRWHALLRCFWRGASTPWYIEVFIANEVIFLAHHHLLGKVSHPP